MISFNGKSILLYCFIGAVMLGTCASIESYKYGRYQLCDELNGQIYQGGYSGNKLGTCMFKDYGDVKVTLVPEHLTREQFMKDTRPRVDPINYIYKNES